MRVVLFRIDKIGDLIVSTPVIAAIRATAPQAKIMLVASPYNAVVAEGMAEVDEIVLLSEKATGKEKREAQKIIKAFKPTHALVLSPKHNCYVASLLSGAKDIGWIVMEYRPLAKLAAALFLKGHAREEIPRTIRSLHHSEHILRLARRMKLADGGEYPYLIGRNAAAEKEMEKRLSEKGLTHFIAVHLVDKWLEEEWREDDVRNFLHNVEERTGLKVVATAGPADKKLSTALAGAFPLFQNLSFGEWTALLGRARIIITPDCSAVHIACARNRPLLALYQRARYSRAVTEYGPQGSVAIPRALGAPERDVPLFLSDIDTLLKVPA